jgi:hypothetical protein
MNDSDFDHIASLAPRIFTSLRRLHTCDIDAWMLGIGENRSPEKSLHMRRPPHSDLALGPFSEEDNPAFGVQNMKRVWTTTMDLMFDVHPEITYSSLVIEVEAGLRARMRREYGRIVWGETGSRGL